MRRRNFLRVLGSAGIAWPLAARAQQSDGCGASACSWPRCGRSGISGPLRGVPAGAGSNWAGPTAATCGSTSAGPRPMPTKFANTRRNWPRSRRTSSWRHGRPAMAALLQVTRTVPIVFVIVIDPVGAGFVESLARPGGNATGFMMFEYGLSGKWLELLKQIAPDVTRVAVLRDPAIPSGIGQFGAIQAVAPSLGVEVEPGQRARRRRDRAQHRGFRALREWRPDRDGEPAGDASSRSDHQAGGPVPSCPRSTPPATSSPPAA